MKHLFFLNIELIEIKQQLEHSLGSTEFLNKLQRARSLSESASETPSEQKTQNRMYLFSKFFKTFILFKLSVEYFCSLQPR